MQVSLLELVYIRAFYVIQRRFRREIVTLWTKILYKTIDYLEDIFFDNSYQWQVNLYKKISLPLCPPFCGLFLSLPLNQYSYKYVLLFS